MIPMCTSVQVSVGNLEGGGFLEGVGGMPDKGTEVRRLQAEEERGNGGGGAWRREGGN